MFHFRVNSLEQISSKVPKWLSWAWYRLWCKQGSWKVWATPCCGIHKGPIENILPKSNSPTSKTSIITVSYSVFLNPARCNQIAEYPLPLEHIIDSRITIRRGLQWQARREEVIPPSSSFVKWYAEVGKFRHLVRKIRTCFSLLVIGNSVTSCLLKGREVSDI